MSTKRFIPEDWKRQWSKFMVTFFDYLPTKYEANSQEWAVRKLIWDFKDGERWQAVANMVARKMREQFGKDVQNVTFVCIPASSAAKNEKRYRKFCYEVARLAGCQNGYRAVEIEGERLAIHETKTAKRVQSVEVIRLNKEYLQGRKVLIFDDVLTQGHSYARFACALEKEGAQVLGGYFLGKTICGYNY